MLFEKTLYKTNWILHIPDICTVILVILKLEKWICELDFYWKAFFFYRAGSSLLSKFGFQISARQIPEFNVNKPKVGQMHSDSILQNIFQLNQHFRWLTERLEHYWSQSLDWNIYSAARNYNLLFSRIAIELGKALGCSGIFWFRFKHVQSYSNIGFYSSIYLSAET